MVDRIDLRPVEILGVRFPRLAREQAVELLLDRVVRGVTTAVCFPDMSTMNLVAEQPAFRDLIRARMMAFNDGAGLAWAARRRGRPFPANLNGTDLTPMLLQRVPEGTGVYLLGARPERIAATAQVMADLFWHVRFVGFHHGYLDEAGEAEVIDEIRRTRPRIVLVGMGNPAQVNFIGRHVDDPSLAGIVWLAVGGFFDYYAGALQRAPEVIRKVGLEWLYIVLQQPHKVRRYFGGIPRFLGRCVAADLTATHGGIPVAPRPADLPPRAAVKGALRCATAAAGALAPANDGPRVLCYHGVTDDPADEWSVTTAQLREHLALLASECNPVPLERVVAWVRGRTDLPPRAVAVTFDDGYTDVLERAAPLMAQAGVPGTAFVSPALATGGAAAADPGFRPTRPLMDWDQVLELRDAGWTIGSHGMTHAALARLPDDDAVRELSGSRRALEDRLGERVQFLAYPYGTPGTVSRRDRGLARRAGYEAAFAATAGTLRPRDDLFGLARDKVLRSDGRFTVAAILAGGLDLWRFVERTH